MRGARRVNKKFEPELKNRFLGLSAFPRGGYRQNQIRKKNTGKRASTDSDFLVGPSLTDPASDTSTSNTSLARTAYPKPELNAPPEGYV